jgi:hypothetical protein
VGVVVLVVGGFVGLVVVWLGVERGTGPIPLLYGGVIPLLGQPGAIPGYCSNLYLVEPDAQDRFHEESDAVAQKTCGQPLRFSVLDV